MQSLPQKSSTNQKTQRAHRRQVVWQIYLPLLLGALFAIALFVLILRGGSGTIERSSQTATILLSIPVFVFGLIFLALGIMLIFGLSRLIHWLPPQSFRAQKAAQRINSGIADAANAAKQPFMLFETWGEAISRVWNRRG